MKAAIAAIALSAAAVAAPFGAAHAHTAVTVGIEAPGFGIRIGTPYVGVAPVYPAPVYVPPPVYVPAPVVYAPPPVVIRPPVVYPVVYPYGPPVVKHHRHNHRKAHRVVVPGGYAYGRY